MGWWSESIMGGDSPLDLECDFNHEYGLGKASPEQAVEFIKEKLPFSGSEQHIVKQVVGFIMIQRQCEMSDELRQLVLEGIAEEDLESWKDPDARNRVLTDFKQIVLAYPTNGGKVDLPHQRGLLEELFSNSP